MSADAQQPAPSVQCRQSDSVARTLSEVLQEQETQRKITAMIQESARAFIAGPEPTISPDAPASPPNAESSKTSTTTPKTLELLQQPENQGLDGGILQHLLRHVEISSFVEIASDGVQLAMIANLPPNLFRPRILGFCPVVSFEISPISPSRDCIIEELEMIAMGKIEPRQPKLTDQRRIVASQESHLPAPIAMMVRAPEKSNTSSITIDEARELLRRPRAKLKASGLEKDGGLELFRFGVTFPLGATATEERAVKLEFSTVSSVNTSPVSLTKRQAYMALAEYAGEDEE